MRNKNNNNPQILAYFRRTMRKKEWKVLETSKYNFNFAYRFEVTPCGMRLNRYHVNNNNMHY